MDRYTCKMSVGGEVIALCVVEATSAGYALVESETVYHWHTGLPAPVTVTVGLYVPFTVNGVEIQDPHVDETGRDAVDPLEYYGLHNFA